jgi:hypothetical protein
VFIELLLVATNGSVAPQPPDALKVVTIIVNDISYI